MSRAHRARPGGTGYSTTQKGDVRPKGRNRGSGGGQPVRAQTSRASRSARAKNRAADRSRPLYARVLKLQHINPGGFVCFLLAEGVVALATLMALAELVNWWAVPLLPLVVAGFVKINDIIAGVFARVDVSRRGRVSKPPRARGVAKVRGVAAVIPMSVPVADQIGRPATESLLEADSQGHRAEAAPRYAASAPVARRDDELPESTRGRRRATNQRPFAPVTPTRPADPDPLDGDW